jgi:hypothetical protein
MLQLLFKERRRLQREQAAAAEQPAAAVAAEQAGGFIAIRSAPAAPASAALSNIQQLSEAGAPAPPAHPALASAQQLDVEEEVVVRGVCDGCGQNVMSNDEGRKREDDKYYHSGCIKGLCGGCGRLVHANSDRVRLSGVYWHSDCV